MPVAYSSEFKNEAVSKAYDLGIPEAAKAMNVSIQSIRNWKKEMQQKNAEPVKFSEEFKELAVERAAVYGAPKAAAMMGVSVWSIRTWTRLKKQFGSAAARDPRPHEKRAEPEKKQIRSRSMLSSSEWAHVLYEIYAREQSEEGFAIFKERLDRYADMLREEKED